MAIQHWSKTIDASNRITWKKETLSSSNANNVLVTNPIVTSTPDNLDNVLGNNEN